MPPGSGAWPQLPCLVDTASVRFHPRGVSLPTAITASRIVLSPVFVLALFAGASDGLPVPRPWLAILWVLYAAIELSDLLDGYVARRTGSESEFGRVFDPFADVAARLAYFVGISARGLLPLAPVLIILYRELGMLFLRGILARGGTMMGAAWFGKAKTVGYAITAGLVLASLGFPASRDLAGTLARAAGFAVWLSAAAAVGSFLAYLHKARPSA